MSGSVPPWCSYVVVSKSFRPDIQKPRQMENAVRDIQGVPGECARHRENVPYVKVHRYNPKHLYPKLNGYGDNGERSLEV